MTYPNPEQRQVPDLLYRTRAMVALLPEKRAKWSARFQWIQMDEVQDTHVSEYGNELTNRAALARNLDFLATDDASIPILTVHQSKDPEFDTVIITRLSASPSTPSATPRFASSNPHPPIVPAPRPFATFAPCGSNSSHFDVQCWAFDVRCSLPLPSIPILTVHQSKGLEFDTVIIAGLAEDEFPRIRGRYRPFKEHCGGSANVTGNSGEIRLARCSEKWNIAA